jgi:hypothetical protein
MSNSPGASKWSSAGSCTRRRRRLRSGLRHDARQHATDQPEGQTVSPRLVTAEAAAGVSVVSARTWSSCEDEERSGRGFRADATGLATTTGSTAGSASGLAAWRKPVEIFGSYANAEITTSVVLEVPAHDHKLRPTRNDVSGV